ncbi:MAG: hypothetical protein LQ348_000418 [Seirophora lacunosa]|nr:MAG: hypothetical protein LQ344_003154 [Seirophora lacunosa]KAI4207868.1 MAG: hypothetical protein LQ348_000418 [Seirophora lacunosa]
MSPSKICYSPVSVLRYLPGEPTNGLIKVSNRHIPRCSTSSPELVLDVLSSEATKRDAKFYLSRFTSEKSIITRSKPPETRRHDVGVNLGNLYVPARAIDQSPVFVQRPVENTFLDKSSEPLHIALVKIRDPQHIMDATLQHVALTLVQLSRLGMTSVLVVDCDICKDGNTFDNRLLAAQQADRVAAAIEIHDRRGVRRLDSVLEIAGINEDTLSTVQVQSGTRVTNRNLLLTLLRKGEIPVVAPIAFTPSNQTLVLLPADEALLALTREFAGLKPQLNPDADPAAVAKDVKSMQKEVSLDKIILLDSLGGIPAANKADGSHVFINLEQEYDSIKSELSSSTSASQPSVEMRIHSGNLTLFRNTLALLPPSSSGLLTSPKMAAHSTQRLEIPPILEVGTRRQRNPLIHNLLTDKPVISPSLPSRRGVARGRGIDVVPTTMIKRGMPVTMIPDPQTHPWLPPTPINPSIQFADPRIDFVRLSQLIEDSFGRKLNVPHYLARVQDRIAGVIIAGEYEGCAVLTWESPSHDPSRMVPYLDKFAVLKRSQGAGGIADVIFTAMVRTCLPGGVCWRSRKNNPANKWYFERAKGHRNLPDSDWTIFWTREDVEENDGQWPLRDYESVCRKVEPSWEQD